MNFAEFLASDAYVTALVFAKVSIDDKFAVARVSRRTFDLLAPECKAAAAKCDDIIGLGKLGSITMYRAKKHTIPAIYGICIVAARYNRRELVHHLIADSDRNRLGACFRGACSGGHAELVQELIDFGKTDTTHGLKFADKRANNAELAQQLLDFGPADIDRGLDCACAGGHTALAEILIAKGASSSDCIREAVINGHTELAKILLHRYNYRSITALLAACKLGHIEIAEMLVESRSGRRLMPGLLGACLGGQREIAERLIDLGALKRPKTIRKCVDFACFGGHVELATWLFAFGPTHKLVRSGLIGACAGGQCEIAEEMIRLGASNIEEGLLSACERGHTDIAEMMIDHGARNITEALVRACFNGYRKTAYMLISRGAAVPTKSQHQITCDVRVVLHANRLVPNLDNICWAYEMVRTLNEMTAACTHC